MMTEHTDKLFRNDVSATDATAIRALVAATGFFSSAETDVAVELVDERLARGAASGYEFILVEADGKLLGYACFGEIPCTVGSYDLYWIVVDPEQQGTGIGRGLMRRVESAVAEQGGRGIYVDTSGKPQYASTHGFYQRCGYKKIAELPNFYGPEDAKLIYWRQVTAETQ